MNYCVLDGMFPVALVREAEEAWPLEAPWVDYSSENQRKRSLGCSRIGTEIVSNWPSLPEPIRELLRRMMALDVGVILGIEDGPLLPDTLLWGAGLHEMRAGDFLGMHLDADRHPLTGMERRANAILCLSEWQAGWGGGLRLQGQAEIPSERGRLSLFATDDQSIHGVPEPLRCPPGVLRKTLAIYWWGLPREESKRDRALFVGSGC